MSFDTQNGTILGTCIVAGIYVFGIRAHNADGASDPMVVTVGIEIAAQNRTSLAVEVDIDLVSRIANVGGVAVDAAYQHAVKNNDDLIYNVRFTKGGIRVEPPITKLAWSCKRDPDGDVLCYGETWAKIGFGDDATWALHVSLENPALLSELEGVNATGTSMAQQFVGFGEFEWFQSNDGIGPTPLRGSSQAMKVLFVADYRQAQQPV
jgi:hypothetical protein